jgi:hypothetical protein
MPSFVAATPDVRMECLRSDREEADVVPAGGPSRRVTSRLDLRAWERMGGFEIVVRGLRSGLDRSKGAGRSLFARVRVGSEGTGGGALLLSCSREGLLISPARGCRMLDCAEDN